MIVISGALVLVAAVLLVLGIVSSITLVYAAIGLSLVSAVFLLLGVFQRPVPAGERTAPYDDDATRGVPAQPVKPKEPVAAAVVEPEPAPAAFEDDYVDIDAAADYPLEPANADFERRAEATGANVLVISGRPRYHLGGCEYVEGHEESEPLDIIEARELGFTPCGVCRPNETLALSAAGREPAAAQPAPTPVPAPAPVAAAEPATSVITAPAALAGSGAPAQPNGSSGSNGSNGSHAEPDTAVQPAAPAVAVPVAAAPVAAAPVAAAPVAEPVLAAPVVQPVAPEPVAEPVAAAPAAPAAAPPVKRAPRKRTTRAPKAPVETAVQSEPAVEPPVAAAPAAAAPAAPAARPRAATRTVQAVAATKEYHRSGCVLLEGHEAEELTKAAAIRQGFLACGVCKP